MILPEIVIHSKPIGSFLFSAADSVYFDEYGRTLINSVLKNTNYHIHVHIYNPTQDQINFCDKSRVSLSYEILDTIQFESITNEWLHRKEFDNVREKQMFDKGMMYGFDFLKDLITKTYYACCRFIRLYEIMTYPNRCLAIDIDGLVRGNFDLTLSGHDFYLYQKKNLEHLAGAILLTELSEKFLFDYSRNIKKKLINNDIYWFMDQVVLDRLVPKFNKGLLPLSYIDWEMSQHSSIWSAKGKRKFLQTFTDEQKKYNF